MFGNRAIRRLAELQETRNEILQERLDLLKEENLILKYAMSEWRRLYATQFDMVRSELSALNGWVATISASRPGVPMPSTVDLDPDKVFEGLEHLGPIGGEDELADMTIGNILGINTPAPVTDEEIVGDDAATGEPDGSRS